MLKFLSSVRHNPEITTSFAEFLSVQVKVKQSPYRPGQPPEVYRSFQNKISHYVFNITTVLFD